MQRKAPDLLFDVDVVIDICADRPPFAKPARDAIDLCLRGGGRLWLYAGSLQSLESGLCAELMRQNPAFGAVGEHARDLLRNFAGTAQWLSVLPAEAGAFLAAGSAGDQLLAALDRFAAGSVKLLTRDCDLLTRSADRAVTPEQYCKAAGGIEAPLEFTDLGRQQDAIRPQLERNMHRVLHHGQYILGPEVEALEAQLADHVRARHCVTVASGTEALLIGLMAAGIGAGDEVITTPFTFAATAEVIVLLGATPVFVDVEADTGNIDAGLIEAAITSRTKAIVPVSLYGQAADMDAINSTAARHGGIAVIEDAAQSFGATYRGRKSCGLSLIGCTSFFPSKPLGCYGDGGALFTDDYDLARIFREIRVHGQSKRYVHSRIGVGGRMDTMQCAVLLAKLERFPAEIDRRKEAGQIYLELIAESGIAVEPMTVKEDRDCVWGQFTVRVSDRERVQEALRRAEIPTAVHYPTPLFRQPAYRNVSRHTDCPVSEALAKQVLSLPFGADISTEEQKRVVQALSEVLCKSEKCRGF